MVVPVRSGGSSRPARTPSRPKKSRTGPTLSTQADLNREIQAQRLVYQNPTVPGGMGAAREAVRNFTATGPQPAPSLVSPSRTGGGGSGGGGGGGGGGGTPSAQPSIDYLSALLRSGAYTAKPMTDVRNAIGTATQADLAAVPGAYAPLNAFLSRQTNPYANVQLQDTRVSNEGNPYLESQGVAPLNQVSQNPADVGARGAFQNVLSLLGAGWQSGQQSRQAESQMGQTFADQQIRAMDNAMLAQVAMREADAQNALDAEKRKVMLELASLIGQGGAVAPDLPSLGIYAPGGNAQDPYGWAAIAANLAAQGG